MSIASRLDKVTLPKGGHGSGKYVMRHATTKQTVAAHPDAAEGWSAKSETTFAPNFFVIGAMKAGTTTLCQYLKQFSEIGSSRVKETDYFILEKNHALGEAWYQRQFDHSRPLLGEASPNYTKYDVFPGVPERIAKVAPNALFLFSARDPVDRFVSHYRHSWAHGHMRMQPEDLLNSDSGRHMIECSRYGAQIDRYLMHFNREQFLFIDFDELCETPQAVADQAAEFLGVGPRPIQPELPLNTADQTAQVPGVVKRAARSTLARRLDRFIPKVAQSVVRGAFSIRKPDPAPELDQALLEDVADLLFDDAKRFREISGRTFGQWCV